MTSTSADLAETGPQKCGQDTTCRKLWEPSHRSGGNFDLDGHQWLSRGLLTLVAKRIYVELERAPCPVNGLSAGAAVYVASGNLRNRRNEPSIAFALDGDDVAKLHVAQSARR